MTTTGRLTGLQVIPGDSHIRIMILRFPDGTPQSYLMRRPEHTFGAWMWDGVQLRTLAEVINKVVVAGNVTVELNHDNDQQFIVSVNFISDPSPSPVPPLPNITYTHETTIPPGYDSQGKPLNAAPVDLSLPVNTDPPNYPSLASEEVTRRERERKAGE